MTPILTTVIPAYNRVDLLQFTLESVRRAIEGLDVEILIVDDGSKVPIEEQLTGCGDLPIRHIRQENRGSLQARLHGLREARGRYVHFLDSDDLVRREKYRAQVAAMEEQTADVSYSDRCRGRIRGETIDDWETWKYPPLPGERSSVEVLLTSDILSGNCVYRTEFARPRLLDPFIPVDPLLAIAGDLWTLRNLAPFPAKAVKVEGFYSILTVHDEERNRDKWEYTAVAAQAMDEAFLALCPETPCREEALRVVGEQAFLSWRRLPIGFYPEFDRRRLAVWRQCPKGSLDRLGGRAFRALARIAGPVNAGRLLRRVKRLPYEEERTMDDAELNELMNRWLEWSARLNAPKQNPDALEAT